MQEINPMKSKVKIQKQMENLGQNQNQNLGKTALGENGMNLQARRERHI